MSDKKTIYYTTQIYRNTQQDFRGHSLYQHQFFRKQKYTTFLSNYTQYYSSYYKIAESVNDTDTVWLQLLTLHVMAPGWILVRKSLEQTLQSRLKYNLPAQEAVSSCHSAVTPWSWGKNPCHDLWAFPTTLHLSETQNCSLLAGMRGPRSAHHSETPGAEHSPTIPPQPPLLKPSGLWMGTKEPQVRKAHCACGRREGHGRAAFLFCLSHGTTAIAPWCHGASLVLLKHVSMSHHICSCSGNSVPSVPLDHLVLFLKPSQTKPISSACHNAHFSLIPGNHKGIPCICAHTLPVSIWLLKSGFYSPEHSGEYQGHLGALSSLFESI